jgi:catechol 2,3-dioxygenase-like lactoylglutathione lyase family enzyme
MRCSHCHAESPAHARFCTACGVGLPRCRACGATVSTPHRYCGACGVPLVTGPSGVMEATPPRSGEAIGPLPGTSLRPAGDPGVGGVALPFRTLPGDPVSSVALGAILHVQLAMPAGEEATARAFYGGLLGLDEVEKPAALQGRGGVWFRLGAQELHLGVEADFRPARKAHPAFAVDHLERLRRRLDAHGVPTRDDVTLPDRTRFYCDDPFGNRLEFVQAP